MFVIPLNGKKPDTDLRNGAGGVYWWTRLAVTPLKPRWAVGNGERALTSIPRGNRTRLKISQQLLRSFV
jgi:hypothetical protein